MNYIFIQAMTTFIIRFLPKLKPVFDFQTRLFSSRRSRLVRNQTASTEKPVGSFLVERKLVGQVGHLDARPEDTAFTYEKFYLVFVVVHE